MDWRRLFKKIQGTTSQRAAPADRHSLSASQRDEDDERISLIVRQLSDPDSDTRRKAFEAIGALGSKTQVAVPKLISLLQHPDHNVRRNAVVVVGRIGLLGAAALPDLIKTLADQDRTVRRRARIAILEIDPEGNALVKALGDPDVKIRTSAVDALPRVTKLPVPPVSTLVSHLADDNLDVSQSVMTALVSIGSKAVPALMGSLRDDRSRSLAIRVLAEMGETAAAATPQLIELTKGHDVQLTGEIVDALSNIGPDAVAGLRGLLTHPSQTIRARVVTALAKIGASAKTCVPALVEALADPDIQQEAVKSLGALGLEARDAVPALVTLLDGEAASRDTVSSEICYALARMDAASQLIVALKHSQQHVRRGAALAMATMHADATFAVPDLISSLEDPSEEVQRAAVQALHGILPDRETRIEALLTTFTEKPGLTASDAPWHLMLGEYDVPVLLARLTSESSAVRRTAARALRAILPSLTLIRIPHPFGGPDYVIDFKTVTPDGLSRLLRDHPDVFQELSFLLSPDQTFHITGPRRRGAERLPELVTKVRERQRLLSHAESELAKASGQQSKPPTKGDNELLTRGQAPLEDQVSHAKTDVVPSLPLPPPPPKELMLGGAEVVDPQVEVIRYPTVDAEGTVISDAKLKVTVDLKLPEEAPSRDTPLVFKADIGWKAFSVQVVLSSSFLDFRDGQPEGTIVVRNGLASIPFVTSCMVKAIPEDVTQIGMRASFSYRGRYAGSIEKFLEVTRTITPSSGTGAPVSRVPMTVDASRIALDTAAPRPRLTVQIEESRDTHGGTLEWRMFLADEVREECRGLPDELKGECSLGSNTEAYVTKLLEQCENLKSGQHLDFFTGVGKFLYDRAPEAFKKTYQAMFSMYGIGFPVQFVTDDPYVPWELMLPYFRDDASDAEFLGIRHPVARWLLQYDGRRHYKLPKGDIVTIAPEYPQGGKLKPLPEAQDESQQLRTDFNAIPVDGNHVSVLDLFHDQLNKDVALLHFAGHGQGSSQAASFASIELEDGALRVLEVRTPGTLLGIRHHTLAFFNACRVGAAGEGLGVISGWAEALIDRQFAGFIAPLWAVYDKHAAVVSTTFVRYVVTDKLTVASALQKIRQQFAKYSPTYLSYLYYGDVMARFL